MPSERIQRVIDGYLDDIEAAAKANQWNDVVELSKTVLELDETNNDAQTFLGLALGKTASEEINSREATPGENQVEINSLEATPRENQASGNSQISGSQIENDAPDSLGGWLVLVGLGLIARPIMLLLFAISVDPDSYIGSARTLMLWDQGFAYFFILTNLILGILFLMRSMYFPRLYVIYLSAAVLWSFIAAVSAEATDGISTPDYWIDLIVVILSSIPWALYMVMSKQVRATFTR